MKIKKKREICFRKISDYHRAHVFNQKAEYL